MTDCIFCKIAAHQIPSRIVYEDDDVLAFEDIDPKAPVHIQVIPRRHIARLSDLDDGDGALIGRLVLTARRIAADRGISGNGYRIVSNCNADGGQAVYHIHFHLLGGRQMNWPPG